jgi:MoaA/NifB/PqqE/SkfB family radical SAM enzyme
VDSAKSKLMIGYTKSKRAEKLPRLPLIGNFDLTYDCNNRCRHCWLRLPEGLEDKKELSTEEIMSVVDQARNLGCRQWNISGGEPMLRPDFPEIFDYITRKSITYSLNTNGSLITPEIADLLKRKGRNLISLYGATAKVHDHITRNPGSFEATLRGFAHLKEAGTGFIVQLVPMRDNYHQFKEMTDLARSLSPHYRVGAPWLFFSAYGSDQHNNEILDQRLAPKEIFEIDKPDISYEESSSGESCMTDTFNDFLLARCIASRREFHIDPYGCMTFCSFIKDPSLRYDLRRGTFNEAWDNFIPNLGSKIKGGSEYQQNCACCEIRKYCRWCDVYGYLEHRRHGAKVEYLCQLAREKCSYKEKWMLSHRRYYEIAGITIQLNSDIPINENTFHPKFKQFEAKEVGKDMICIHHHFELPNLEGIDLGKEYYRKSSYGLAIYRKVDKWIYCVPADCSCLEQLAIFNDDHTKAEIYNSENRMRQFLKGGLETLTQFRTDQTLLARVLSDRQGCFFHASAGELNGHGLIFIGHSGAGKSTTIGMLKGMAKIISEDRPIIRYWPDGFRVHGSWDHIQSSPASSESAPLRAIFFLKKADHNCLVPIINHMDISTRLAEYMIKPLMTKDWWQKAFSLFELIAKEVPCYEMEFDLSGKIIDDVEGILQQYEAKKV